MPATSVSSVPLRSPPKPPGRRSGGGLRRRHRQDAEVLAQAAHLERKPYFYTILVSGVDDHNGGSDTNILVAVDAENDYIYGVSIPRDTKAVINGKNHKINFAYNSGGTALLAETISQQLGIPVDFTVTVDLDGFAALVNAIGAWTLKSPSA